MFGIGRDLAREAGVWIFVEEGRMGNCLTNGLIEWVKAFYIFAKGSNDEELGFGLSVRE